MSVIDDIHQLIDTRIRQKTADGSIQKTDVADALDTIADALYVNANKGVALGNESSYTVENGIKRVFIDPDHPLPRFDLTLPQQPTDGDELVMYFGGTEKNLGETYTIAGGMLFVHPNEGQRLSAPFQTDFGSVNNEILDDADTWVSKITLVDKNGAPLTKVEAGVNFAVGLLVKPNINDWFEDQPKEWALSDVQGSPLSLYINPLQDASVTDFLNMIKGKVEAAYAAPRNNDFRNWTGAGYAPGETEVTTSGNTLTIRVKKNSWYTHEGRDPQGNPLIVSGGAFMYGSGHEQSSGQAGTTLSFIYQEANRLWFRV